ncbi:PLD nuclease N-terminal domain-containing protein [Actinophytocola sp.]|uniref:PLD nuclease N-terminal domain-containing protein n=1 Tax=Actinophytocola sp. TaxID=1872138 RepID=UPI002D800603|nr:PLD nuclease N-terminal domain-containing protein [Actinophytocola sp.]HET9139808.1 PLD nuclease N-terminal domain-containing protein [Actinophytocola sp.]
MTRRHWKDLTPTQRAAFVSASAVQIGLAAAAWTDLARRPQERVNGRKPLWAAAIAVNFVGPIAYLLWGRAKTKAPTP